MASRILSMPTSRAMREHPFLIVQECPFIVFQEAEIDGVRLNDDLEFVDEADELQDPERPLFLELSEDGMDLDSQAQQNVDEETAEELIDRFRWDRRKEEDRRKETRTRRVYSSEQGEAVSRIVVMERRKKSPRIKRNLGHGKKTQKTKN